MKSKLFFLGLLLLLGACQSNQKTETSKLDDKSSNTKKQSADSSSPKQKFSKLLEKYETAKVEYREKYQKQKFTSNQQIMDFMKKHQPLADDYADEAFNIVANDQSDSVSYEILSWLVKNGSQPIKTKAFDELFSNHSNDPRIGEFAIEFSYDLPNPTTSERLRTMAEKSPHKKVRAVATYALARYEKEIIRLKELYKSGYKPLVKKLGKQESTYLLEYSISDSRLKSLFNRVGTEFREEITSIDRSLIEKAESALFELEHLAVGKIAPEIKGVDIDGVEFKLSDFRGKVVMLSFWGDW